MQKSSRVMPWRQDSHPASMPRQHIWVLGQPPYIQPGLTMQKSSRVMPWRQDSQLADMSMQHIWLPGRFGRQRLRPAFADEQPIVSGYSKQNSSSLMPKEHD